MGIKGGWRGIALLELAKELVGMVVGGRRDIGYVGRDEKMKGAGG